MSGLTNKILTVVLFLSISSFFGVLTYRAIRTHNVTTNNCTQIKNLRQDILEVFSLSRDQSNNSIQLLTLSPEKKTEFQDRQNLFYEKATKIIQNPRCEA